MQEISSVVMRIHRKVRITFLSWDVWVFFVIFIWILVFHLMFDPTSVKKYILLEWLPKMIENTEESLILGTDIENAIAMASTFTFTLLDITLRSMGWWFSTFLILFYTFSRHGISAILLTIGDKYMIVAEHLKVYRKSILITTILASLFYALKDYIIYLIMVRKGIEPVSAGWLFIINVGGLLSMITVTIIWVLLPNNWLEKMWLVRASVDMDKGKVNTIDIAPRTFIGYFVAFIMVSSVVVLLTYPAAVYWLPIVCIFLFVQWWLAGFLISILVKMLVSFVKPSIEIQYVEAEMGEGVLA